jgi:hypothetical protein
MNITLRSLNTGYTAKAVAEVASILHNTTIAMTLITDIHAHTNHIAIGFPILVLSFNVLPMIIVRYFNNTEYSKVGGML